jgi:prepilin-type processing-associated H-X9-DG protein
MKAQRLLVFIASAIVLAVVVSVAVTTYWQRKQPVFKDAPKLISAMQAFSQDLTKRGQALPPTVSLRELVSGGYIAANEVRAFEGMEVTIWLTATDHYPPAISMSARFSDGSVNVLLFDGSVQQLSRQKYDDYLKQSGQPEH